METDKPTAIVKLILALFLLAGIIRIADPWTRCLEDQKILFAEENNKGFGSDVKEKQEQEQAFSEFGSLVATYHGRLIKHPLDLHQYIPTHQDEPSSPPPNITHS